MSVALELQPPDKVLNFFFHTSECWNKNLCVSLWLGTFSYSWCITYVIYMIYSTPEIWTVPRVCGCEGGGMGGILCVFVEGLLCVGVIKCVFEDICVCMFICVGVGMCTGMCLYILLYLFVSVFVCVE